MNNTSSSSSSSSSHYVEKEEDGGEEEEERAKCEWDFHLAAVVSSSSSSGNLGASDAIGAIDFDPSGRLLATGGIARKIRVYEVEPLLSPSERGGGGGEARATSFKDHAGCCARCVCAPAKLSSVRWRPDGAGRVVGCGDYDGVVAEYDVAEGGGAAVFERDEHAGRRVWSVDYAPDGSLGASGSDDRSAHVWDARSGPGAAALVGVARAGGAVCCVEFDPGGGPWVALGSADRKAYVYDLRAMGRGAAGVMEGTRAP
uniref:Uncharacterized protein n=1 Tax=Ananas comosus var. bracteatus TaxID=296719 RepID=A0A6V7NRN7_ANACO|nr:unnamed protein product [Ananas comosus var. bracteatus]